MPSPRPPRNIGRLDFSAPALHGRRRAAALLPPRARQLLELMVFGLEDGSQPPMKIAEAAAFMGIKVSTAKLYFGHPRARAYYMQLIEDLRDGERPANLHTAVEIRDSGEMKKAGAAGARARIESMRFIEQRDDGVTINNNVGVTIAPGYQIGISAEHAAAADRLLKAAGASRTLQQSGEVVDAEVIEKVTRPAKAPPRPLVREGLPPSLAASEGRGDLEGNGNLAVVAFSGLGKGR